MSTNLYLENTEPTVREGRALRTKMAVDFSAASSVTLPATGTGAQTITSASANALTVGPAGTTNPTLNVDASTASAVTGLNVKSAASGAGIAVTATSSNSTETIYIDAKGNGGINLNTVSGTGIVNTSVPINIVSTSGFALLVKNASNRIFFNVDGSTGSAATGVQIKSAAAGSGVAVTTQSSGTDENITIAAKGAGTITFNPATVATAGGAAGDGIMFGSLGVGVFTGTGTPTFSAMNGSLYVDSNATTTTTRLYVNKSGAGTAGTTWTNFTAAA